MILKQRKALFLIVLSICLVLFSTLVIGFAQTPTTPDLNCGTGKPCTSMSLGTVIVNDVITPTSEVYGGIPANVLISTRQSLMQDLANAAKGNLALANGTLQVVPPGGTSDALISAILTKYGVKVWDANGTQIFP